LFYPVLRVFDMGNDVQIFDVRQLLIQRSQLVKVRRKQTERVDFRCDMSSPGQRSDQQRK
jgi:hypothetical protein